LESDVSFEDADTLEAAQRATGAATARRRWMLTQMIDAECPELPAWIKTQQRMSSGSRSALIFAL
jgi:hypothetical protein